MDERSKNVYDSPSFVRQGTRHRTGDGKTAAKMQSVRARSSVDRVLASEAKGRWFDSSWARHPP